MISVMKIPEEVDASVDIPKGVLSYWPVLDELDRFKTVVGNVCLVLRNSLESQCSLSGVQLYFLSGAVNLKTVYSIGHTLLDPLNPLTRLFSGEYLKYAGEPMLEKYDGVDDVRVDATPSFILLPAKDPRLERLLLRFSKPCQQGETVAVRFLYEDRRFFRTAPDGSLHFSQRMFSGDELAIEMSKRELERLQIPGMTAYDTTMGGGFDIFLYMPLSLVGDRFAKDPICRLLPEYDYLGRPAAPFWKHCWNSAMLLGVPETATEQFNASRSLTVAGVFIPRERRQRVSINNREGIVVFGSTVSGPVTNSAGSKVLDTEMFQGVTAAVESLRNQILEIGDLTNQQRDLLETHIRLVEIAAEERKLSQARSAQSLLLEKLKENANLWKQVQDEAGRLKNSLT